MRSDLAKKAVAEFIGTFTLVFAGCGAIMMQGMHPDAVSVITVPLVFGLAVASMIYAVGHISGAHFNPSVTLAFAVVKRFAWKEVPVYWLAQCMGAMAAIGLLYATLPETGHYGATIPTLSTLKAILWESALTFFLMFVIMAVATDGRAAGIMAGAAIGATVMLDAFIGGPLTGASMNPARSLAPALFSGVFHDLWIYLLAPCAGAVAAAVTYDAIRCEPETGKKYAGGCC